MKKILGVLLFSLWTALSLAEIVTTEELCQKGDTNMCHQVELEKSIGATGQFGPNRKYVWQPSEMMLNQISPQNYQERAAHRTQLLCIQVASSWISKEVSEYERSAGLVAVDRHRYNQCMTEELPPARTEELKMLGLESLKFLALILGPIITFLMFWYRRPLSRQIRNISEWVSRIGSD